jgi:hypothetical protein
MLKVQKKYIMMPRFMQNTNKDRNYCKKSNRDSFFSDKHKGKYEILAFKSLITAMKNSLETLNRRFEQ